MGVQRVFLSFGLFTIVSSIHAQVAIKERITIDPKPEMQPFSLADGPLLRLNGNRVEATMPGVIVTGSLSVTPASLPENTAYEVWVSAGGSSHLFKRMGTGYCVLDVAESTPFPYTFRSCGIVSMTARSFVPAPWQWSCSLREAGIDPPVVNGNTATITARGTLWYTGFTAILTISASLDESYLPTEVVVAPSRDTLGCHDGSLVDVRVYNGQGNLYTNCGGGELTGTATILAQGEYAYLEWMGKVGKTIPVSIVDGKGAFLVVLDTSKGFIQGGVDVTTIQVEVEGKKGSNAIVMYCSLPQPSVAITSPETDTTITLSRQNLPEIIFRETHSPAKGQPFEPSISWTPGPTLSTAGYYGKIKDSVVVPVKVSATNLGGTATDERKITLKEACDFAPPHYRQGDPRWANTLYDKSEKGIRTLGCALTCMAMVMTAFGDTVTPKDLNEWKKERINDEGGFGGERVNWKAVEKHNNRGTHLGTLDVDSLFNISRLDDFLQQCELVIAKVFNPASVENKTLKEQEDARTNGNHWILILRKTGSTYAILDPGRGLTTLAEYGRIYRYVRMARNQGGPS